MIFFGFYLDMLTRIGLKFLARRSKNKTGANDVQPVKCAHPHAFMCSGQFATHHQLMFKLQS
jgi:hypothetical protein